MEEVIFFVKDSPFLKKSFYYNYTYCTYVKTRLYIAVSNFDLRQMYRNTTDVSKQNE